MSPRLMITLFLFFIWARTSSRSTLFPYTTLFRSLQAVGLRKVVLLSPYKSNRAIVDYLHASGVTVVHDDNRRLDRKSTRLNSSHQIIPYAAFCLKKNTD